MPAPFQVYTFSLENLKKVFLQNPEVSPELIHRKNQIAYLFGYLRDCGTKKFIVEENYIDKDYLEDFSYYYVRCFHHYEKFCKRLHFWGIDFSEQQFKEILAGNNPDKLIELLKEHYKGFIVMKPLPNAQIGKTCLETYRHDDHRFFPTSRKYTANLFGINFCVTSLAFQEQDHVVSACATSALWSIFHKAGDIYHQPILSPVEITKRATEHLPLESRAFPNEGLSAEQMANAIRSVGLEPYFIKAQNLYIMNSTLYAYLKGKIPAILGVFLINKSTKEIIGKHAVAVTGYSLSTIETIPFKDREFKLVSSFIDKIYVHDDQLGPFAKMEMDVVPITYKKNDKKITNDAIATHWPDHDDSIGNIYAIPLMIIIPLYHKIRIPFEEIHDMVYMFDKFIHFLILTNLVTFKDSFTWDIYLITVNDLKTIFFEKSDLERNERSSFLTHSMPHFIWRATAIKNKIPILDLLFDATDVENGNIFFKAINYDKTITDQLHEFSKLDVVEEVYKYFPAWKIISWFRDKYN